MVPALLFPHFSLKWESRRTVTKVDKVELNAWARDDSTQKSLASLVML